MKDTDKVLGIITGGSILVFIVILLCMSFHIKHLNDVIDEYKNAPTDTTTTVTIDSTEYKNLEKNITERYEKAMDSVELNVKYLREIIRRLQNEKGQIDTCILYDTVIKLWKAPREYLVYKDSTYRAVISGIDPRLDTLKIYRPIVTQTINHYVTVKEPVPFLRPQAGLGVIKEIGGKDSGAEFIIGGNIKGKYQIQAKYQRMFESKKNYGGISGIVTF